MRIIQTFYEAVEPTCDTAVNIHRNPRDVYEDGANIIMKQLSPRVTLL